MAMFFYDFFLAAAFLIYLPYLILKGKWHRAFITRFGILAKEFHPASERPVIWIHAVSVGEVLAVGKLIRGLKQNHPGHQVVLTTVTSTGYSVAQSRAEADYVLFAPLDFSFAVNRYIEAISPDIYIAAETEIWPNLFVHLKKKNVPIVLVNGRLSDKSFKRYQRLGTLARGVLNCVECFGMQTPDDVKKISALGIAPQKISLVGNMKFDDVPTGLTVHPSDFGFETGSVIWIAGSTHPGEEEIVLNCFKELNAEFPSLKLIVAPRHIERSDEIAALFEGAGFRCVKFSQLKTSGWKGDSLIVVDTIGDLKSLYGISQIVFIGKSLTAHGGQNMIEPAFFGNCILIGPYYENFKDVVGVFESDHAIVVVDDGDDLRKKMRELLADGALRKSYAEAARRVVQKYQGATRRSVDLVEKFLRPE